MANYKLPWNYEPAPEALNISVSPNNAVYIPAIPDYLYSLSGKYMVANDTVSAINWSITPTVIYANGNSSVVSNVIMVSHYPDNFISSYIYQDSKFINSNYLPAYYALPRSYQIKARVVSPNSDWSNVPYLGATIFLPINIDINLQSNFRLVLTDFRNYSVSDSVSDFDSLEYLPYDYFGTGPVISASDTADSGAVITTDINGDYILTCSKAVSHDCALSGTCYLTNDFHGINYQTDISMPWTFNFKTYNPNTQTTLYNYSRRAIPDGNYLWFTGGTTSWWSYARTTYSTGTNTNDYVDNYGNKLQPNYALFNTGLATPVYQAYGASQYQQLGKNYADWPTRKLYLKLAFSDNANTRYSFKNARNVSEVTFNGNETVDVPFYWEDYNGSTVGYSKLLYDETNRHRIATFYVLQPYQTYSNELGDSFTVTETSIIIEPIDNGSIWGKQSVPMIDISQLQLYVK